MWYYLNKSFWGDLDTAKSEAERKEMIHGKVGSLIGMTAGGLKGAAIGTAIAPGVGTAIGGLAGTLHGMIKGSQDKTLGDNVKRGASAAADYKDYIPR